MSASLSVAKIVALPSSLPRLLQPAARFHRVLSATNLPLRLHTRRSPLFTRFFASSVSATAAATTISVGDQLPDATLSYFDSDGELQTVTVSDLTKGKKAILFAVPGAFTPTCSQKHLPGFVEKAGELRAKGVDTIACISVNDAFVMRAWKKDLNIRDEVLLLSDGNGEFTRALGVELDLSDKPVGLGVRSRRYALLAEDGVVKVLNLDEGGSFTISGPEDLLKVL
ncbi:peroxiredoxin-2E-1, chloroplastic-like [Zingiber officinale]|uniref:peroxiredoxin-2E-1, chloroplastic-like n=1 Tax=Zingiber officinale TaxID=94328 RepID=UPI001C4AB915|nr:peroxiredoxin-2E-1, chloroplastic-like [Zingiber officinale]